MKIGKFEIDSFVLDLIVIVAFIVAVLSYSIKLDLEKEKTEQLKIEKDIEYYKSIQVKEEVNNNG